MCEPSTALTAMQIVGTGMQIGGSIAGGNQAKKAEYQNAAMLERQGVIEAHLNTIEDQRTRERFEEELSRQTAELAGRGISLDSPSALLLAEDAGREKSFASREVRTRGRARQLELRTGASAARSRGRSAQIAGYTNAAGAFLTGAPDIWDGLKGAGGGEVLT